MTFRTSTIRIAGLAAALACATASVHASDAAFSVEARAPLQATLMPTMSIVADANDPSREPTWSVADTAPLAVTLMPTVTVTAQAETLPTTLLPVVSVSADADLLATTTLPTVRVIAHAEPAKIDSNAARFVSVAQVNEETRREASRGSLLPPSLELSPR